MTFVVEKIDTPEKQAEFDKFDFRTVGNQPLKVPTWVVDRDRGQFFVVRGGGGPEIPVLMTLVLSDGSRIEIKGRDSMRGLMEPSGLVVRWEIQEVDIPQPRSSDIREVANPISEALKVMGYYGHPELAREVHIKFTNSVLDKAVRK